LAATSPVSLLPVPAEAILDDIRLLIAVLALDGTIRYVNAEVLRRSGEKLSSVVGWRFSTARWWTHVPGASEQVEQALEQARMGRTAHLEIDAQISPTQRMIARFEVRPVRDTSSTIVALIAEGQDITDQRTNERKLRETHFRWRTIADFTVDWEFWLHPNGYFLYVSPSCQRVSGYDPEDFMQGRVTLSGIAHPEDKKRVLDTLTLAFSGSTEHHHSWRLMRRDGAMRWVSMSWQSVHDEDGAFMGVRGSIRDITDLMKTQEELQRSVEAYRTLARHFPKGMVALLDRDLRFVVCDGPAFEAVPIDPRNIVGKRLYDVLNGELRARIEPLIASASSGKEIADIVHLGATAWLVHLTPIRDPQDRIAHIIASAVESQDLWADAEQPTEPDNSQ
jgi:PAS domain S-box-containing protein